MKCHICQSTLNIRWDYCRVCEREGWVPEGYKIKQPTQEDRDELRARIRDLVESKGDDDVVWNESNHTLESVIWEKTPTRHSVVFRTRPGQGVCSKAYPEAARLLREHNAAFQGWPRDRDKEKEEE